MVMFLILFFPILSFSFGFNKSDFLFSFPFVMMNMGPMVLAFAAWSFGLLIRLALFWRMGSFSSLHFLSFASLYHFLHLLESSTGWNHFRSFRLHYVS